MSLISGIWGAEASSSAGKAQASSIKKAAQMQLQGQREAIAAAEKALAKQIELNEPFRQAGVQALPKLIAEIDAGAPTFDDYVQSPEAAAIREQELKDMSIATERTAAAKGNLFAPATQIELQKRANIVTASSKLGQYENALQRRERQLSRETDLVNIGRGAATEQASDVGAAGSNISNIIQGTSDKLSNLATEAGNARASSYINSSNAISNASNKAVEGYMLYSML